MYRVDGEIGRFEFRMFDVKDVNSQIVFKGIELFPFRKGKQWYQTCGFKEIALLNGVVQRSYRETANILNRIRYQEEGGTPLNTLRDGAESEGLKVIDFLVKKSVRVLSEHGFDVQGTPQKDCVVQKEVENSSHCTVGKDEISRALKEVCEDMVNREMSPEMIEKVKEKALAGIYEEPEETTNIYIDDVGVKEQKAHRKNEDNQWAKHEEKGKGPTVQNTVARVEHNGKGFTLTGRSTMQVLRFVLCFLLENKLITKRLIFITDGLRSLQGSIGSFMVWHPAMSLLLDWFHLVKKFREELSLACKGREIRNRHLRELLPFLWFGMVDIAKEYLEKIPEADLKNAGPIKRLDGYLDRNRKGIPCYALRGKLKLPNSSNPVERSNNMVTSKRQKHNGMSWSPNGSYALTALSAVVLNGRIQQWVKEHTFSIKLEEKTA